MSEAKKQISLDALKEAILSRTDEGLDYLLPYARSAGLEMLKRGKEYRSKGSGKICIRRGNRGTWFIKDFSGYSLDEGDIFSIYAKENHLSYVEGVKKLAEQLGINIEGEENREKRSEFEFRARTRKEIKEDEIIRPGPKEQIYFKYLDSNFHKFCRSIGIPDSHLIAWKVGTKGSYKTTVFGIFSRGGEHINSKHVPYLVTGKRNRSAKVGAWYIKAAEGKQYEKHLYGLHLYDEAKDTIIVESEKTAVLGSYFYPTFNWLATGGSSGTKPEKINSFFTGKAGHILYLSDNDKAGTDNKTVKTLRSLGAKSEGLEVSIINPFPNEVEGFDVADYISTQYKSITGDLERDVLSKGKSYDPFYYEADAKQINISGHIGKNEQAVKALEKFIFENERTQLVAPTGSGKTTFIFEHLASLIATEENPLIISVPTQALADQISSKYKIPCIREGIDKNDIYACEYSKAIVCTYDSLKKLEGFIPSCSALVIDESHHFVLDCSHGFKFDVINKAYELAKLAPRVVAMSATPCHLFDLLGFKFIEIKQEGTTPFNVVPVLCEGRPAKVLLSHLENVKDREGIEVIFFDNKKQLSAIKRLLKKSGLAKDSEIALMHGKNKNASLVYSSIIEKEIIPEGIKYVLCTRLLADGVNINNTNIAGIHLVNVINEELFIQFPARFRKADRHLVYAYRVNKEKDISTFVNVRDDIKDRRNLAECMLKLIERYPGQAQKTQLKTNYKSNGANDPFNNIFRYEEDFRISDLHIFHSHTQFRDFSTSASNFYSRIESKYDHVSILDPVNLKAEKAELIEAEIQADLKAQREAKNFMYLKLEHEPEAVLAAVHAETNSDTTKELIEEIINPIECEEEAQKFRKEHKEIFEYRAFEPVKQFAKLHSFGFSLDAVQSILSDHRNRSRVGFARFESTLHLQQIRALQGIYVDGKDRARLKVSEEIKKTFLPFLTALSKGHGKEVEESKRLSADKIRSLIKSVVGYSPGRRALKMLKELFIVHEGRDRKTKRRFYYIEESKILTDILAKYGQDFDQFSENAKSMKINKVSLTKTKVFLSLDNDTFFQDVDATKSNYVPF